MSAVVPPGRPENPGRPVYPGGAEDPGGAERPEGPENPEGPDTPATPENRDGSDSGESRPGEPATGPASDPYDRSAPSEEPTTDDPECGTVTRS